MRRYFRAILFAIGILSIVLLIFASLSGDYPIDLGGSAGRWTIRDGSYRDKVIAWHFGGDGLAVQMDTIKVTPFDLNRIRPHWGAMLDWDVTQGSWQSIPFARGRGAIRFEKEDSRWLGFSAANPVGDRTLTIEDRTYARHDDRWRLLMPCWFLGLVSGLLTLPQFRHWRRLNLADKRRRLRLCVKCGYDLRGSPDRCPECGHSADQPLPSLAE